MRTIILAAAAALGVTLTAASPQAAFLVPRACAAGDSAIVLAAGGCGPGFHPQRWVGRYGRWHVRCVPNRRFHRACPPGMRLRTWRGPYGRWHRRCVPF